MPVCVLIIIPLFSSSSHNTIISHQSSYEISSYSINQAEFSFSNLQLHENIDMKCQFQSDVLYMIVITYMSIRDKRKVIDNHIFHIKIGPNAQKLNVKDPAFLKILQQEYATKYLQNLGAEATAKNINKILRQNPLQNCEIIESRLNGGLHTDTITIVAKQIDNSSTKKIQNQHISGEMLQVLNLKPMKLKKAPVDKEIEPIEQEQKSIKNEKEQVNLQILDFNIKSIKERYIFPFNQNFVRKNNYKMKDNNNILDIDKEDSKVIYEARIFNFPFTQIKLSIKILKQLQTPINVKLSEILIFLEKFYQQFPLSIFPITTQKKTQSKNLLNSFLDKSSQQTESQKKKYQLEKYNYIMFEQKQIDKIFQLIKSQENAKFIGVFLHLSYWSIFGGVNPIQIDKNMKRKMYTMMVQTVQYFQIKIQAKKLWTVLAFPMILLTLKMAGHYFFSMQYPKLFQSQQTVKTKANQLALDKITYFVQKLFDQGNINGRFIFLESDIDGEKGNFIKDKKFIRKRIFGTSPALNLLLSDPKNGKTRSIMAKNMQIDQQEGTISDQKYLKIEKVDQQSQQKLLNLALHKIKVRIQQINSGNNPIINLDES